MVQLLLHFLQLTEHGNSKKDTYDVFDIKPRTEFVTSLSESPTSTSAGGHWDVCHLLQLESHLGTRSTCNQVQLSSTLFLVQLWCPSQIPAVLSP